MSSWSEGLRILHPNEASPEICLKNVKKLEGIQRKVARFVTGKRERTEGTITSILADLKWSPLALRCKVQRLNIPHKALTGEIALPVLDHVIVQQRTIRNHQGMCSIPISTSTVIRKYSFWPRTIMDWNAIPPGIMQGEQSSFKKEDCDGSSNVIRWSVFLAAPIHLYYMFLTNCTKWHNLGMMLPSFAEYFPRCRWSCIVIDIDKGFNHVAIFM